MLKNKSALLCFFLMGIWFWCPLILADYATAAPKYLIKFATVAPEGSTWIKHMKILDKDLRLKSDSRLGYLVYAGGIAGDELDILRKIRIGQIHCSGFSGVGFGQILPMVRVMDLPFLFKTYEETDRVHRELHSFFADQFRKKGFELLAWADVGNVYLFSKKPIRKMKDLSGLKVWAWTGDPIAKETFTAMGINPIPLAITDVTIALSTGMIDTFYAPPLGALALQWYTSINYMLDLPIVHPTGAILISSKFFGKLPQELSMLLSVTTEKAMADLTLKLRKQNDEAIQIIKDSGVVITPAPSGGDLEEFYNIHDQVARKLTNKIYPKELLDKIYGLLKRSEMIGK
ncbi:MAG: TRAP transporter substrate-binding protein DctP [Deltaproteobacteria bacterium]|nr:TRAP transporter substrate-binding protein DctP [Deltaproteobacteria bacterium]